MKSLVSVNFDIPELIEREKRNTTAVIVVDVLELLIIYHNLP